MDYLTLVKMKETLTDVKKSMEHSRDTLLDLTFEFGQNVEAISGINTQLEIVNHNLDAVSKAVLMKEAEPFEHWQEFEALNLHNFCLN
jgi:predicted  nucleic acid-binding Zn-ribbon protein